MKYSVLVLAAAIFMCGNQLFAQDNNSNIRVVSYYQCDDLEAANAKFEKEMKPELNKMVEEGKLNDWGYLNHYWGDRWNVILHYDATDLSAFEDAFGEVASNIKEKYPDGMDEWNELCSDHKDNIYTEVFSSNASN